MAKQPPLKPLHLFQPVDMTDLAVFVRTSGDELVSWDRQMIVNALVREAGLDRDTAETVSRETEEVILKSGISVLTSPLIREIVDAKLIEKGLEKARRLHARLGLPLYDVEQLIVYPNRENASVPHGPEATNLTLAESIKKEYALMSVFSQEVSDAHVRGDIHLHNLGFIDRLYSCRQNLEYIKKFGLSLPTSPAMAKPARHPEVLLAHMVRFSAALQSNFAGVIGWDALNLFFAPFLEGMGDREMRQLAQMMMFDFSQQAVARGGQSIFSDIHLHWEVPNDFKNVEAIGPGGRYTGRVYGDYARESKAFLKAILEVCIEGDGSGQPFFFPRPVIHITETFWKEHGNEEFLLLAAKAAGDKGSPLFTFDRGSQSEGLGFRTRKQDHEYAGTPWRMRSFELQNVSINLPRIAYESGGNDDRLLDLVSERMVRAARAHTEKKAFIERLLSQAGSGPLALLTMNRDGQSFLRMQAAKFLIGMVGLNELVQHHTGREMHESREALAFGRTVVGRMEKMCRELRTHHTMPFELVQTPAESTAYRFARLDLRHHAAKAAGIVKGDVARGEIYYTNSTCLNVSCTLAPAERMQQEGLFHPAMAGGALTQIWLGERMPEPERLTALIRSAFHDTDSRQVVFTPEFTSCISCNATNRGLFETCPSCGADTVEGITRITGHFTRISGWNRGKLGELKNRHRSAP